MPAETIGLYVGKFQPFHNGHLFAVKNILPQVDKLIIAIGSSQYSNVEGQPFSAQERQQMIEQALTAEGLNNSVVTAVPDIHDPENWVEHLCGCVTRFDVVFTNNDAVARLFKVKNFEMRAIPVLPGVSGSLIRQKLASKDPTWQSLVPPATAQVLQNSSQVGRLLPS